MSDFDAWLGAALPLVSGGLLVAAAVRGANPRYARVAREGGTVLLPERIMHGGYAWIEALAAGALRLGLNANAVSWISLGLGLAAGAAVGHGWLGAGAWLLTLSGLGDGVDGAVARQQGQSSPVGAVLDSVLDRYVEFFYCAGLVLYFAGQPMCQLAVVTALFGGFLVTYSTAKAEALHVAPPRGWMKRPERIVWLIGGSALGAAGRLGGVPSDWIVLGAVLVIAVFAHASGIRRLLAVAATAGAGERK